MLTEEQCAFFMRKGYVVLRGVMDRVACDYASAKIWSCMPDHFRHDEPQSWSGPIEDCRTTCELFHRRGHVKFQKGEKAGRIGLDPRLLSLISRNAAVTEVVRQLLGKEIETPRVRGLYSVWPMPASVTLLQLFAEKVPRPLRRISHAIRVPYLFCSPSPPHIEGHPMHIVAVGYLTDAPQNGGALLVWPGSHCDLYPQFRSTMEHLPVPGYQASFDRIARMRPVQITGKAGDVILFHHRLMHAASVHRRRNKPRHAIFVDFSSSDARDLVHQQPTADVWEHWDGLKARHSNNGSALADMKPAFWRRKQFDGLFKALRGLCGGKGKVPSGIYYVGARSRAPGDVWVLMSDDEAGFASNALETYTNRVWCRSMSAQMGSKPIGQEGGKVTPFNVRSYLEAGESILKVTNDGPPLFLRVVELSLPFHESRVLFRGAVTSETTIDIASLRDHAQAEGKGLQYA